MKETRLVSRDSCATGATQRQAFAVSLHGRQNLLCLIPHGVCPRPLSSTSFGARSAAASRTAVSAVASFASVWLRTGKAGAASRRARGDGLPFDTPQPPELLSWRLKFDAHGAVRIMRHTVSSTPENVSRVQPSRAARRIPLARSRLPMVYELQSILLPAKIHLHPAISACLQAAPRSASTPHCFRRS